nr:hypothetical protein CFP56_67044 [Quercus suber]
MDITHCATHDHTLCYVFTLNPPEQTRLLPRVSSCPSADNTLLGSPITEPAGSQSRRPSHPARIKKDLSRITRPHQSFHSSPSLIMAVLPIAPWKVGIPYSPSLFVLILIMIPLVPMPIAESNEHVYIGVGAATSVP